MNDPMRDQMSDPASEPLRQWDHLGDHLGARPEADDETEMHSPEDAPEDAADRFGIKASLLVLGLGLVIAALSLVNSPSFGKCSALQNLSDRVSCYEGLRQDLFKPPAKGPDAPKIDAG